MQAPYVCRPCLARLRSSPSRISRSFRATLQTASAQEEDTVLHWPSYADRPRPFSQHGLKHGEQPAGAQLARRYNKESRDTGIARSKSNPKSLAVLRSSILRTDCKFGKTWDRIAGAYDLPMSAARETAGQLERLLLDRPSNAASLYAKFEAWKLEYGKLLRQFSDLKINPQSSYSSDWAVFADDANPSIDAMKASWLELDQAKRETLWSRMIQSMLIANPELLSSFLRATYDVTWSPFYVVEDSVRLLLLRIKTSDAVHHETLADLVLFLLESNTPGSLQLGQDVIGTIVSRVSVKKASDLFHYLNASGLALSSQTLLQFASKFAKTKDHKVLAAEILCSMVNDLGFDINSPAASSVCTSLLHLPEGDEFPQGSAAPDELFRTLLEAGLRPNLLNITALMRNFCVRGHLDTAWTVFDLLLEYGIEPDEHVYSTLLHASKQDLNVESVRRIMATIHSHDTWNPAILNDFLDIIFKEGEVQPEKRRRQRKSNNAFRTMLHVYSKFFRLEPLQNLCSFPLEDYLVWEGPPPGKSTAITDLAGALLPQPHNKLMMPDTITLSLMLSAAIRGAPRFYTSLQSGVKAMLEQVNHFNRLFESGDASAVAIVKKHGTLIYDVFIRGMLQFQQCLHPAVHLVKTMLELATDEHKRKGKNIRHPRPSVHTWTMLVNGFKNHRQPGIAASMVRMMIKEGGVKPNMITWNSLITAFARVNDAHGAVRAIRYLERSGLRPDKYTIQAISAMNSRARKQALTLMEASKDELIPEDDDVAYLLAASRSVDAAHPDPVLQQQRNEDAPPLSDQEVWDEMQRLTGEGDALLSHDDETYIDEDSPAASSESTEALGVIHPRNANQIDRLLEYKTEVDAFISRVHSQEGTAAAKPLIETSQPIARFSELPAKAAQTERVKAVWTEAFEARNRLRDLNVERRPIGLRHWEEGTQRRLQARAANFREGPVGVKRIMDATAPLGIVAQQDVAPHPRVTTSRRINPRLRRDVSREKTRKKLQEEPADNSTHD